MTIRLDHTIAGARDKERSATFLAEMLGLPAARLLGKFAVVQVGDTSISYVNTDDTIRSQHYAFLVSEAEFDTIFERIRQRNLQFWADPSRRRSNQINTWDDGRGLYFDDPNGHLLEILTRPYGSGGTAVDEPHPLVSPALSIDRDEEATRASRAHAVDECVLARAEQPGGSDD